MDEDQLHTFPTSEPFEGNSALMFQDSELWDWIKNKMANAVWESVFLYLYIQIGKKKMEVLNHCGCGKCIKRNCLAARLMDTNSHGQGQKNYEAHFPCSTLFKPENQNPSCSFLDPSAPWSFCSTKTASCADASVYWRDWEPSPAFAPGAHLCWLQTISHDLHLRQRGHIYSKWTLLMSRNSLLGRHASTNRGSHSAIVTYCNYGSCWRLRYLDKLSQKWWEMMLGTSWGSDWSIPWCSHTCSMNSAVSNGGT